MMVTRILALALAFLAAPLTVEGARPNIVLCMADDLGWGDTGFNGHPQIVTPHLDEMAKAGVKLNRYYAGAPVCSPTRGSCLTGRNPFRYGIPGANSGHLKKEEINLAELLKEHGYATGHFGKWHLGTLSPKWSGKGKGRKPELNYMTPGMAGFDQWFTSEFSIATYNPYDPANGHCAAARQGDMRAFFWHNGKPLEKPLEGCTAEMVMNKAIPFLSKAAEEKKPFFAVIWFHAPHQPVVGHPLYMKRHYADRPEAEQQYFSCITALDAQVGRLRAHLRKLGVAKETLLIFASDNGPEGNPGAKGTSQGSAGKFRGRKRSLYEGGLRVPAVVVWPGTLAARVVKTPCVSSDYFPTIAALLGSPLAKRPYDGIDILPILKGEQQRRESTIGFRYGRDRTLVSDRFKLVHNAGGLKRRRSDNGKVPVAEYELYNLVMDPFEMNNIVEEFPQVTKLMKKELAEFVTSCDASATGRDYR
ncbi:MAG: sulfatase-like hydrolase/transferase [Roseibacillus sp.]